MQGLVRASWFTGRSPSPHVPSVVGGLLEISEVSVYNSDHGALTLAT